MLTCDEIQTNTPLRVVIISESRGLNPQFHFERPKWVGRANTQKANKQESDSAREKMIEERRGGAPHGVLLAVVVMIMVALPVLIGEPGEAITGAISELLSPVGLLIVLIGLLVVIQFLSSERGSFLAGFFNVGGPDSIHRLSGSPVGVGLFVILVIFLLNNRVSIFRSFDDSDE